MMTSKQLQDTNILDIHIKGEVDAEDYESLRPVLERMTTEFAKVHLLMTAESMDMTPGAMWADLKMSKHLGDLGRMAIVTNKDWLEQMTDVADALPGLELRQFEPEQRAAALDWLAS